MIDLGISKLALIGAVALIVIGPERLPRVARTVGALVGRAQRYINDVKAEVSREVELEELRKMRTEFEDAAHKTHNGRKSWRVKQGARPLWFKRQQNTRMWVQSGAARVKRHRPASGRNRSFFE